MPWTTPFEELRKTVRHLIWVSAIFGAIMCLLAIAAISTSAYVLYIRSEDNKANITRNTETLSALCRQLNIHNTDLQILLLDQGVPYYKLLFLSPKNCNLAHLREKYGAPARFGVIR